MKSHVECEMEYGEISVKTTKEMFRKVLLERLGEENICECVQTTKDN